MKLLCLFLGAGAYMTVCLLLLQLLGFNRRWPQNGDKRRGPDDPFDR